MNNKLKINGSIKDLCENSLKNKVFVKIETKIKNQLGTNKIYFGYIISIDNRGFLLNNPEKEVSAYLEFNMVQAINQLKEKKIEVKENESTNTD